MDVCQRASAPAAHPAVQCVSSSSHQSTARRERQMPGRVPRLVSARPVLVVPEPDLSELPDLPAGRDGDSSQVIPRSTWRKACVLTCSCLGLLRPSSRLRKAPVVAKPVMTAVSPAPARLAPPRSRSYGSGADARVRSAPPSPREIGGSLWVAVCNLVQRCVTSRRCYLLAGSGSEAAVVSSRCASPMAETFGRVMPVYRPRFLQNVISPVAAALALT